MDNKHEKKYALLPNQKILHWVLFTSLTLPINILTLVFNDQKLYQPTEKVQTSINPALVDSKFADKEFTVYDLAIHQRRTDFLLLILKKAQSSLNLILSSLEEVKNLKNTRPFPHEKLQKSNQQLLQNLQKAQEEIKHIDLTKIEQVIKESEYNQFDIDSEIPEWKELKKRLEQLQEACEVENNLINPTNAHKKNQSLFHILYFIILYPCRYLCGFLNIIY